MKCSDIIARLMERLPRHSALFTDSFTPESVTVSGTTITIEKEDHGLITGRLVSLTGAVTLTGISSIVVDGESTILTTATAHDLTEDYDDDREQSVTLSSVDDPTVDGSYVLESVDSRYQITIAGEIDEELTDVLLHETREMTIDGLYSVTRIDDDNFRVTLPEAFSTNPVILASSVSVHHKMRISGGASIERIIENYTAQPPTAAWAFVVLENTTINKDRYSNSDADMEQGGGSNWNGLLLSPFSVYVFVPCENEITGRAARDTCEDVRPSLYKSLLGMMFSTGFTGPADSAVIPRGDEMLAYMKAFYVHRFQFMQAATISESDTSTISTSVAMRALSFDFIKTAVETGDVLISGTVEYDTPETE